MGPAKRVESAAAQPASSIYHVGAVPGKPGTPPTESDEVECSRYATQRCGAVRGPTVLWPLRHPDVRLLQHRGHPPLRLRPALSARAGTSLSRVAWLSGR